MTLRAPAWLALRLRLLAELRDETLWLTLHRAAEDFWRAQTPELRRKVERLARAKERAAGDAE